MNNPVDISIVVPVFNEEDSIPELFDQLENSQKDGAYTYEVIIVNDGSTDNTLGAFKKNATGKPHYRCINLAGNFGQSTAMTAGIDHAEGEFIVTMDGDLQNDPGDILAMLKKMQDGDWDLVAGIRSKRKDGFFLRKIPSRIANLLIRNLTGVMLKDYGCTLKIFRKDLAKNLGIYGELHRFIPILAKMQGARITDMDVKHHHRKYGKAKYGIERTFKVLSDLILMLFFKKYMQKPMHFFGKLGMIILLIGTVIDFYMLYLKILGHDIWGKPMLILGLMLTLGGVQILTFGFLAEMQMRTYYESQQKKTYRLKNIVSGGQ
jgi:glycosyltransferase involved in cell wall biosynthesis